MLFGRRMDEPTNACVAPLPAHVTCRATGDRGSCYAPPEMDSVIKLVHFGLHMDQVCEPRH